MPEYLDAAQSIASVDPNGEVRVSAYFEDYLYKLIESLGGEGSTASIDDLEKLISVTSWGVSATLLGGQDSGWHLDRTNHTGTEADAAIVASNVTQHVGAIDHDSLLNFVAAEHKLEGAIDHDALTNYVAAEHLLVGAIDHDSLLNFAAGEHFTEGSIDHANILSIGSNAHSVIDTHLADTSLHSIEATTTELADVTDAINTAAAKELGYMVLNTTTGLTVFASGNTDGADWHFYDSSVAHSPV